MPDSGAEHGPTTAQLLNQVSFLEAEVAELRRRLADGPGMPATWTSACWTPSARSRR